MNRESIRVDTCPVCSSSTWEEHSTVKDWRGSEEHFHIRTCNKCGLLVTSPRPADDRLGAYYPKSDYVSHTDKAKSLFDRVYFLVQKRNLVDKHKKIAHFISSGSLLDYGCGAGAFMTHMQENGWTVSGVELDESAARIAGKRTQTPVSSPDEFQAAEAQFDLITLWHVLEHLPEMPKKMKDFFRWLKPGGYLYLALPNHRSKDAVYYGADWAAWDVPIHLWHFNQHSMASVAEKFGFSWEHTFPMPFDAYYVSMISAKNQGKPLWPVDGLWQGWISNRAAKSTGEASSLIYVLKKPL